MSRSLVILVLLLLIASAFSYQAKEAEEFKAEDCEACNQKTCTAIGVGKER